MTMFNIPVDEDYCGRSQAAALIKTIQAEGGTSLAKMLAASRGRLRKPAPREKLSISLERKLAKAGIGIRASADFERLDDTFNPAGIRGDSTEVFKAIHTRGPGRMAKGASLPPEDDDTANGGEIADTGASNNWRDQPAPTPRAALVTDPHTASIRVGRPPPTEEDATVKAIKAAQRQPK